MSHCDKDLATDSVPDAPRPPEAMRDRDSHCAPEQKPPKSPKKTWEENEDSDSETNSSAKSKKSKAHPLFGPNGIPSRITSGVGGGGLVYISNAGNVHIGPSVSITYGGAVSHPDARARQTAQGPGCRSQLLTEASASSGPVSLEELDVAAEHVGRRWERLGARLGFSCGQMERLHDEHRHIGLKEVVYQLLLEWRQSKGRSASVGELCEALWCTGQREAAERLAQALAQAHSQRGAEENRQKDGGKPLR